MVELGSLFTRKLEEASPRETGKFAESWMFTVTGKLEAGGGEEITLSIDNVAEHAPYVLFPTKPHDIYPKGDWPLHFFWEREGREVWFMHVHHPGTEGQPVHEDIFREMRPRLRRVAQQMGAETWAQIAVASE